MQKIIDTHMHIFDLNKFRVLWLEETDTLNKPIVLDDYIKAVTTNDKYRVIATQHVELDTIKEQKKSENDYFVNLANDKNTLVNGITIYADMMSDNLEEFLSNYTKEQCVKGVRYILHVPEAEKGLCLNPKFIENVKLLGRLNLIFEACLRCEELADFEKLVGLCPKTQFVLNHMGLPEVEKFSDEVYLKNYKKNMVDIAKHLNVSCKLSGLSTADVDIISDAVNHTFDCFSEDRVMFASNFPVCTMALSFDDWATSMLEITKNRSSKFKDKFFYLNAIEIYKMNGVNV